MTRAFLTANLVGASPLIVRTKLLRNSVPAAALFYPWALMALYQSAQMLMRTEARVDRIAGGLSIVVSLILVAATPALAYASARGCATLESLTKRDRAGLRIAHLAFAAIPLFTALGTLVYLADYGSLDYVLWVLFWLAVFVYATLSRQDHVESPPSSAIPVPVWLRTAHGVSALLLITYVVPHLVNHLVGLRGAEAHIAFMEGLRKVYRSDLVQPVLLAIVLFQILSGLFLLRARTTIAPRDRFATLQTLSGAYVAAFLLSHVGAALGFRALRDTDTNWHWAVGDPSGLLGDPWSVRLIPHYTLAVALVITHVRCGLRLVALARGVPEKTADRIAILSIGIGVSTSICIISAMLGARI